MDTHDAIRALAGGALIGLSTVLLLRLNGRIAGISGIINGIASSNRGDRVWRAVFVFGLVIGAGLVYALGNGLTLPRTGFSPWLLVAAGLLVGFGTRLGSGCTSGHGICGLARLSRRSILAVGVFMCSGVVTVTLLRHAW